MNNVIHYWPQDHEHSNAWKRIIKADFRDLSMDELDALQKIITRERRRKGSQLLKSLKIGDSVMVDTGRKSNRGKIPPTMSGVITEIKRTRAVVDCGSYGLWKVPNTRLTLEE